jgi:hypothetical protein
MKKIAALTIALGAVLLTGTADAAEKWQQWVGTKGPMYFQVGPATTTQNCFGDCSSPTLRTGVAGTRTIEQARVIPDEIHEYDVEFGIDTVYPAGYGIFINGFPAGSWGWSWF